MLTVERLPNMPYDKVYFVKTASLGGSTNQYNTQKLLEVFKSIVLKADQDGMKSIYNNNLGIAVGDWIWGKL